MGTSHRENGDRSNLPERPGGCFAQIGPVPFSNSIPIVFGGPARLPRPARGVLLDTCNVLYDDTVWRRWVLQLLMHLGLSTNYRCFFHVWDRDFLGEVHRGQRDFWEAFEAFLRAAGLSRGQIEEVEAACRARRCHLETETRPLPGVRSTLARLHRSGVVLGAIANSDCHAEQLRQRLDRFGLGELFAAVVSSIDLGRTMPDEVCYHTALEAMSRPADRVAFVGHDPAQLDGAAAVGMPTIAFNFDPGARADVYLVRFQDLADVVGTQPPLAAAG